MFKFGYFVFVHRSENGNQPSLSAQMKHLDMMCVTLERQIDVLSNVDQALPTTGELKPLSIQYKIQNTYA